MIPLPTENIYGHTKKLKFILDTVESRRRKKRKNPVLLDFGCGNGRAVSQYLIRDGIRYFGVDIHKPSIEYAEKRFAKENTVFAEAIPDDIAFDIIVYADILEHLEDPVSVLRSHRRRLKPNGIIVGAVPNGFGPFENEKRLDNLLGLSRAVSILGKLKRKLKKSRGRAKKPGIPYNYDSGHVIFFTKSMLFSTLESAGFAIRNFQNGAFLGAPLTERFLLRHKKIIGLNAVLADDLPFWAVSTWYFTAIKK